MIYLYALYYYDRPLLEPWLSHYCQFETIDEIIIQNQNWSNQDTLYLLTTVAKYVDKYHKKIVVLPSNFRHFKNQNKRSQFLMYGQSTIRNRVTQFLQNKTFIASSMDEIIYKDSYEYTEEQFRSFETLTEERAKKGSSTIGFVPLYCAWLDEICPCNGIPITKYKDPQWRHRLFRFVKPFQRKPSLVHDTTYQVRIPYREKKKWIDVTPGSSLPNKQAVEEHQDGIVLDLNLIHYHPLVHPEFNSAEYIIPSLNNIRQREKHPSFYIERFETSLKQGAPSKPKKAPRKPKFTKSLKTKREESPPPKQVDISKPKKAPKKPRFIKSYNRKKKPHELVKVPEQSLLHPNEVRRVVMYWYEVIESNKVSGFRWHLGLPYTWWREISEEDFWKKLPQHLDPEHEPRWFSDAR